MPGCTVRTRDGNLFRSATLFANSPPISAGLEEKGGTLKQLASNEKGFRLSTRISRTSPYRITVAVSGAATIENRSVSPGLRLGKQTEEHALARSIGAEIRAAFTYVTIAQLAYDMGQLERGDQAFGWAREACSSAQYAARSLPEAARGLLSDELQRLSPVFEACGQQRSDFHASLRQPSLS